MARIMLGRRRTLTVTASNGLDKKTATPLTPANATAFLTVQDTADGSLAVAQAAMAAAGDGWALDVAPTATPAGSYLFTVELYSLAGLTGSLLDTNETDVDIVIAP